MAKSLHQHGFTLQELMISVAIFFIVSALGIPGYISYVRNSTRDNTVTDLYSYMNYARSEAIKLNTNVSLCRTGNANAATPACGGAAQDWTTGWLVFTDNNNNGVIDGTDRLLKIGLPIKNDIQVMASKTADASISFLNDGSLALLNAPAIFDICDDRNNDGAYTAADSPYGRVITVGAMGRPEISVNKSGTCTP